MHTFKTILGALAFTAVTNAFIADLFSDENCQVKVGSRNVYDNTCAEMDELGFSSFIITTLGAGGQYARAYGPDACEGFSGSGQLACTGAGPPGANTGPCIQAFLPDSSSHALGSSASVC